MKIRKKYLLTPVIIPFIIGMSVGCIGYLYEMSKSKNLNKLIIEKDEEIQALNDELLELNIELDEAEPYFNLEEEQRASIKEEYYKKQKEEAQKKKEEAQKKKEEKENKLKEIAKQQEIRELNEINSYIASIESELNEAKDILDSNSENLKSSDSMIVEGGRMKSFGTPPKPFIVVTDSMDEDEAHRAKINNILADLKHYMYDAGSGLLLSINSTDEVEQARGSSSYVMKKRFARSQISKLEEEIEKYKSKYK